MTTTYLFGKLNQMNTMSIQRQANFMIKSFFTKYNAIIGKSLFTVKTNKVIVQVFYYVVKDTINNTNINTLGNALTRCWDRPVELRLIRLNHAVLDSNIFAQYLSTNSNKYSFSRLFDMLKASLPITVAEESVLFTPTTDKTWNLASHITGIKIKLSGRLTTQRSIPRQTTNGNRLGSSAKGSYGIMDFNQFTSKNKLGAFTMKVWISQQSL